MKKFTIALTVVIFSATVFGGFADPIYRGDNNSVHVIYERADTDNVWSQTLWETGPSAYDLHQLEDNGRCMEYDDEDGIQHIIDVPNFIDDLQFKYIRLQLTFSTEVIGDQIRVYVNSYPGSSGEMQIIDQTVGDGVEHYIDIELQPNPDWEIIGMSNTRNLTKIEIDTVSIPEPASMALLGLGALAIRRKRK